MGTYVPPTDCSCSLSKQNTSPCVRAKFGPTESFRKYCLPIFVTTVIAVTKSRSKSESKGNPGYRPRPATPNLRPVPARRFQQQLGKHTWTLSMIGVDIHIYISTKLRKGARCPITHTHTVHASGTSDTKPTRSAHKTTVATLTNCAKCPV